MINTMAKQDLIARNYNHIYAHEMAHKAAGGQFAGAISIERNAEGIPVSGHVPIRMPVLNKSNPFFPFIFLEISSADSFVTSSPLIFRY